MRFCFLAHHTLGGSTKVALNIATELAKCGHRVYVILLHYSLWTEIYQETENLSFLFLEPDTELSSPDEELVLHWSEGQQDKLMKTVEWLVRDKGVRVIHYHYAIPFAKLCANIQKRHREDNFRVIGTLHGTDVSLYGKQAPYHQEYRTYTQTDSNNRF